MIYWELFWSFFQIGLFSIGGGYAALPMIQQQIVDLHGWLTMTAFTDVITIAEMTPGPISLNAATFVGTQMAGLPGAIVATIGCVTPSCVIVLFLAWLYTKYRELWAVQGVLSGLRPAVVGLIAAAGISIIALSFWGGELFAFSLAGIDYLAIGIFAVAFFVLQKWKPNPILVMLGCGVLGLALYSFL